MARPLRLLLSLLLIWAFGPLALGSAPPQDSSNLELLSNEEFRARLTRLKEAATESSFKAWHGDHVRKTTWAAPDPWGRRLPNPEEYGEDDAAMQGGYFTYGGQFGTALFYLVEGELVGAEAARAMRQRLEGLSEIFREVMAPWELRIVTDSYGDQDWTLDLESMPQLSDWGPSVRLRWWLEPIPAREGELRFEVRAQVSALATQPEQPLPTADPKQAVQARSLSEDPRQRAAEAFMEALCSGDEGLRRSVYYSEREMRLMELRRLDPAEAEYESEEERLQIFQEILDDQVASIRYLAEELRETYPVVELDRLRLIGLESLRDRRVSLGENQDTWAEEDWDFVELYDEEFGDFYDEVLALHLAAHYPDSPPIHFSLDLALVDVGSRLALATLGEGTYDFRSEGLDSLAQRLGQSVFGGEHASFLDTILPTHIDALNPPSPGSLAALEWWSDHRCPPADRDNWEPADFVWGDAQQWRRLHLARAELEAEGWDRVDQWEVIDTQVISAFTPGATDQLWVTAQLSKQGREPIQVLLRVEVTHHGARFSVHPDGRFELDWLKKQPQLTATALQARALVNDLRAARMRKNFEASLQLEEEVLASIEEFDAERQAGALVCLASARVQKALQAEQQDAEALQLDEVLEAAQLFDRAYLLLRAERGKVEWEDRGIALDSVETGQELTAIVRICVNAASAEADQQRKVELYEAAARAGSWLSVPSAGVRNAVVQCAQIYAGAMMQVDPEAAYEVLRRYFPIDRQTREKGLQALADRYGIEIASVVSSYRSLAILRYNRAVKLHQLAAGSERPRPALAWQAVEEAWRAAEVVRFSNQAEDSIPPDASLLQDTMQLHEQLSESALRVSR